MANSIQGIDVAQVWERFLLRGSSATSDVCDAEGNVIGKLIDQDNPVTPTAEGSYTINYADGTSSTITIHQIVSGQINTDGTIRLVFEDGSFINIEGSVIGPRGTLTVYAFIGVPGDGSAPGPTPETPFATFNVETNIAELTQESIDNGWFLNDAADAEAAIDGDTFGRLYASIGILDVVNLSGTVRIPMSPALPFTGVPLPGPTGPAGTITVGTVTEVAQGGADVRNVGTLTHAILDFDIPEGPEGPSGPQSPFNVTLYANGVSGVTPAVPQGVVYDITNGQVDQSTIPSPWSLNRTDDPTNPIRYQTDSNTLNPARFGTVTSIQLAFATVFEEVEGGGGSADNIVVATTSVTDTDTGIVYDASDKVALIPSVTQTIDGDTIFEGFVDLRDSGGSSSLHVSGTSGDVQIRNGNDVKVWFDKDIGKVYYDDTNTGTLTSSNANEIATVGYVDGHGGTTGNVKLTPGASQTITQTSGTVLDVRGSFDLETNSGEKALDFSGTSGDLHLEDFNTTTNESNTKVLWDRSSGQLYMNPTSATLNLPTSDDNKVMRAGGLAIGAVSVGHSTFSGNNEEAIIEIGYENVEVSTLPLNVETTDSDAAETFLKRNTHGEIIFSLSNTVQANDLRPPTSASVHSAINGISTGITKVADLSSTTLPNPAEGDVVYLTADWTDTDGTKYYEGLHTYNGNLWVGVLNLPVIASGYPAGTYDSSVPFLNDSTMLAEDITNAGIHRVGTDFELVGNWQTRTEDANKLILDINVGADSGDIDVYDTDGEVVMHLDSSGKKMYYGSNINTTSLNANDEIATIGDLSGATGNATVRVIQPTGVRLTEIDTFDSGGGSANEGQWYWRESQGTNTVLNPASWEDLIVANGDDNTRHQIVFDGSPDQDGNIATMASNAVSQGYLFVETPTGSAILGVSRFSGASSNDYRFDASSIINSTGTPGFSTSTSNSHSIRMSDQGFASVGNDGRVPNGIGNGHMTVWDNTLKIWREVSILVDGLDDDGADEVQSFGLNSIAEGVERRVTTREWQEANFAPIGATGGATSVRIAINNTGNPTNVPASAIAIVSATQQYYNITNATIEVPVQASLSDATTYFNNALQWVQVGDGGGSNNPDSRFSGTPEGLDHSDTGVTVGASIDYNDPSTDAPYTIILPSANTYTFAVGQGVSATDAGTTYTIVRLQPTSTVTEFYISGHHASEFPAGTTLFVSEDGHKQNSIWTLPTQGASAYTQDDNVLNDILSKEASLTEQVQANSTAIAAFQADLVSIAAYQPQGAYLSGAGDITPSFSTDQVDRSGSKTGTGYANTGAIRVYHNGDFEVLTYLLMPEGTNTDGTGTNAPDVDYVSAFEEQFKTEDIIGFALVSGAYNTQGFPHVMNTTLETSYDNGYGTGLKAYFLGGQYQGRVEVRFQGTLTPSQNSDRTFITDHSDRTILYDNYTSYQIFPTNAFWHNVRIADPEQIFLIKEGVYLLHEIADASVPANVGKVLAVEQDQNRVDTFNFPAGNNLSGDLSFTLSRPPNGTVSFSNVDGASITNTGSLITFDYVGAVTAGSFTATYATTGVVAQGIGISGILSGGFTLMNESTNTVDGVDVYQDVDNHFGDPNAYYVFTGATSIMVGQTPVATTVVADGWYKAQVNTSGGTVTQLISIGDLIVAFK